MNLKQNDPQRMRHGYVDIDTEEVCYIHDTVDAVDKTVPTKSESCRDWNKEYQVKNFSSYISHIDSMGIGSNK